jgi:hypothetical protein
VERVARANKRGSIHSSVPPPQIPTFLSTSESALVRRGRKERGREQGTHMYGGGAKGSEKERDGGRGGSAGSEAGFRKSMGKLGGKEGRREGGRIRPHRGSEDARGSLSRRSPPAKGSELMQMHAGLARLNSEG